jgi:predicted dehydrogenase
LLDLGTYPVSLLTRLLGVSSRVVGIGQADPSGVYGQLSVIMTDAAGNKGPMSTTLYGFTPTNAVIVGTGGTVRFGSEFNLPGPFESMSADATTVHRYEEPAGRHFEGLYFEAAEVARCITAGHAETKCRPRQASLDPLETMDMIRAAAGIDFSAAGLA